jgi:hypothetical protein
MIYPYKYKKHKIEKFHLVVMEFFNYLFTKEPTIYNRVLFFSTASEKLIKPSYSYDKRFKELVAEYQKLTHPQKKKVKLAFKNNNQIEKLCNKQLTPVKYSEFSSNIEGDFSDKLKDLDELLWNNYPQNAKIEAKFGVIKNHFDDFTNLSFQKAIICPFCGLSGLKPSGGEYRDAYDHYLPKSRYPFTSLNFLNLVPICTDCNNTEKGDDDTLFLNAYRREVFYPFDKKIKTEDLNFEINPLEAYSPISKSKLLKKIDWDYSTTVNGTTDERIETWESVFRVQGRYKELMPAMESEWFEWLKDRYRDAVGNGVPFPIFHKKILEEVQKQILNMEKGMMRYSYFQFLLSEPKIEQKLNIVIGNV